MWLNLVMNACLSQSTKHSDIKTIIAGLKITCNKETFGIVGNENDGEKEAGRKEKSEEEEADDSSIRFRRLMMESIAPS